MGSGSSATEKVKAIGNSYFSQGEYAKAKSAYSKALRYDKHNHMLLSNRCACYLKLGRYKQALEDALLNLKIAPSWVKTYYRLACVFIELNLFPEALYYLRLAKAIDMNDKIIQKQLQDVEKNVNEHQQGESCILEWGGELRPRPIKQLAGVSFIDIACGVNHVIALTSQGHVYLWGNNSHNQCGVSHEETLQPFVHSFFIGKNIKGVAAGGGHSLAVGDNGRLYAWGINAQGQCGLPTHSLVSPTEVSVNGSIQAVAAGLGHTMILTKDRKVLAAGWNNCGQLGIGYQDTKEFREVSGVGEINHIACGAAHTLFVDIRGRLFGTGSNSCGQLGLGNYQDQNIPTQITENLRNKKMSVAMCGEEFSVVISETHEVFTFGLGNVGQLGDGSSLNKPSPYQIPELTPIIGAESITCNKSQVLSTTSQGQTYTWGLIPDYTSSRSICKPFILSAFSSRSIDLIRCTRESFILQQHFPDPSKSFLSSIPLHSIDTGRRYEVYLNLVKSDGAFLVSPLGRVSALFFTPKGQCILCPCYFEDRRYVIEIKSTESGHMDLYAFLNGQLVRNTYYTITFQASQLFGCKAILPIHSLSGGIDDLRICAGGAIGLTLQGVDKYGNHCMKGGDMDIRDIEILGAGDYESKLIDEESGVYKLILILKSTGRHHIILKFKQTSVEVYFEDFVYQAELKTSKFVEVRKDCKFSIEVYPGVMYPGNTKIFNLNDTYTAGDNVSFNIINYDRYMNTTWHKDSDYTVSIKNQGIETEKLITTETNYCGSIVSFIPIVAGLYEISVKYKETTVGTRSVLVRPAKPHLLNCKASGEGLHDCEKKTAQQIVREIEVNLFDEFSNATTDFNVNFEGIIDNLGVESKVMNITPSCFKIFYTVKEFGNYELKIWIDNSLLPGFPIVIQVSRDLQEIQQELSARRYAEQLRLEGNFHSELRRQEEEQRLKEQELQTTRKLEAEAKVRFELERKLQRDRNQEQEKLKKEQDMELEKRRRIADKIRKQQETERRAQEAIRKLEEERKNEEKLVKKWKRIGGGFIVPFELK